MNFQNILSTYSLALARSDDLHQVLSQCNQILDSAYWQATIVGPCHSEKERELPMTWQLPWIGLEQYSIALVILSKTVYAHLLIIL